MESSDSSRRHRRRGRHSKKRQHYSIDNLRPGRAPVGLPNSMNTANIETESEDSDQELPPEIPSIHARLYRLLNSTKIQPQGPESKIRPLLTKDMSGLGAQARAAEYAAATAARARQVSREAEDQKLPPKAAPISLSALGKAQPTSRNKGPKAWKPLNLDEITESSDDGSTGKDSGRGTSATSGLVMLEWTSDVTNRQASACSKRVEGVKVNIPTAPRAMMAPSVLPTAVGNLSSQRQTDSNVKLPIRHSTQEVYLSPGSFGHGGFPCPALLPQVCSHYQYPSGTPTSHEAAYFQRFGSMMVPSDLSPTKQQQKFAMLGQIQDPTYTKDQVEAPGDVMPHRMLAHQSPAYHKHLNTFNADMPGDAYGWDVSVQNGTYVDYTIHHHPFQDHTDVGYSGNGEEEEVVEDGFYRGTTGSGHPMVQVPYGMTPMSYPLNGGSSPTACDAHTTTTPEATHEYRRSSLMASSEIPRQLNPAVLEQEEPYDRKSKMQRFVAEATHEALARKGKTVLHNPDLYKERDQSEQNAKIAGNDCDLSSALKITDNRLYEVESSNKKCCRPVPWDVRPRLSDGTWELTPSPPEQVQHSKVNLPSALSNNELETTVNAVSNPANKLVVTQLAPSSTVPNDPTNGKLCDKYLNPIDQVGSKEWAKLRPITSAERERVRACMAKAAADLAPKITRPGLFDKNHNSSGREDDLKHSKEWFYRDLRGEQAFRAQIPAIAEKHAALRKAAARHANGGSLPTSFKLGIDDGVAANFIMGEVIANLASYVVGDRKSAEQRRNFHKVKSVPEFATERGGSSAGSGSSDSYFDDEAGFQGAPVRIARDPRFRPQGKEGLKLKPEEEWKNRHEMYGRRVL